MSKIVRKTGSTNLGTGNNDDPLYGDLSINSILDLFQLLEKKYEYSTSSRFLDIGSGIGLPTLCAAFYPGVQLSMGVEVSPPRFKVYL